jgi:hypothetical protein
MLGPNRQREGKKIIKREEKQKKQKPSTYNLATQTQNLFQPCNTLNKRKKRMKTRAPVPFYSQ